MSKLSLKERDRYDVLLWIPRDVIDKFLTGTPNQHHVAEKKLMKLFRTRLKEDEVVVLNVEDNNGGDILSICELSDRRLRIECGQSCVIALNHEMRPGVLISLILNSLSQSGAVEEQVDNVMPFDEYRGDIKRVEY